MRDRLGSPFARVWTASTISNLGDGMSWVAMPLLAATLTRDPVLVSLVAVAGRLPWLMFAFVSGALVDRWDRRRVMWTMDLYRMALTGVLAATVITGTASIGLLVVIGFLLATGELLFDNASQSILPAIVSRTQLERANSRLYSAQVLTNSFAGGPLGGALFATARAAPFLANAASFGVSALLVGSLPGEGYRAQRTTTTATNLWADIRTGARWLFHHRLLRTLSVEAGLLNLGLGLMAVLVLHAQDNLGVGSFGFGLMSAAGGVGAFVGSLIGPRLSAAIAPGKLLAAVGVLEGAALTGIALTSSAVIAGLALGVIGVVVMVWNVVTVSLRQAITPDELLGRVNSMYQLAAVGAAPLGAMASGLLASWAGLRAPMLIGGAVVTVGALLATRVVNTQSITDAKTAARD